MPLSEKDRLASAVQKRRIDFDMALSDKRRYPIAQFRAFWEAGKRYAEITRRDPLIHRIVIGSVYGLTDYLMVERKRFPNSLFGMPRGWRAWFSVATIPISKGMNHLDCERQREQLWLCSTSWPDRIAGAAMKSPNHITSTMRSARAE
jgi:hypothetical protein